MNQRKTRWRSEAGPILKLAFPIMAGLVSQTLLGLADTLMVGRLGVTPLAAASFVNTLIHPPMVLAYGLLSAVMVLSSQAFGAERPSEAGEALRGGLVVAFSLSVLAALGWHLMAPRLGIFGQAETVNAASRTYLLIFGWSIVPALLAHACKQFCEALNEAWIPNAILLGSVLLNVLLNWVFIYGNWGAPPLGLEGAGWATLLARGAALGGLLGFVLGKRHLRTFHPRSWFAPLGLRQLGPLLRVGGPVGLQHLLEVSAFALSAIMMGWLSAEALAAHQIALTCAATTFMFALGVGMAVCVRVGQAWGAGDLERLRRIGFVGLGLGSTIMGAFALVLLFGREAIARAFVPSPAVVAVAAPLFIVAALFQVADGIQITAISALRGIADVRVPALVAIVAYWVVAIPVAYLLGFHTSMGPTGIWTGLAIGLGVSATFLSWRFHHMSRVKNGGGGG